MEIFNYPLSLFLVLGFLLLGLIIQSAFYIRFSKYKRLFPNTKLSGNDFARKFLRFVNRNEVDVITPRQENKALVFDRYFMLDNNIYLRNEVYSSSNFSSIALVAQELGHALTAKSSLRKLMFIRCYLVMTVVIINRYFAISALLLFAALLLGFPTTLNQVLNIIIFVQLFIILCSLLFLPLEFHSKRNFLKEFDKMNVFENKEDMKRMRRIMNIVMFKYVVKSFVALIGIFTFMNTVVFGRGRFS